MTEPCLRGARLALLTVAVSLGIFMNVLDTSIANVAIPTLSGDLGVSPDEGTWVITSFAVSTAIALPLTGWLGKRFGEVRLFVASVLGFTLFSWLCGLAGSLATLVLFRVLQGAAAGPMIPLSQSLLLMNYPDEKKGLALAIWSLTAVVAPVAGPDSRRLDHRRLQLALDLLHQPAGRAALGLCDLAAAAPPRDSHRPAARRCRGAGPAHRRRGQPADHAGQGQ